MQQTWGLDLPDYPWDTLVPYRERAERSGYPICDLSVGTPVDPTPQFVQDALAAASNAPGYPTTVGSPALREALVSWFERVRHVSLTIDGVLPTLGSKELIAWLPTILGLRQRGLGVAVPAVAYPTYQIGAQIAGVDARIIDADDVLAGHSLEGIGLLWLNTPGNPTGRVLDAQTLDAVISRAQAQGVIVAVDECYALLPWDLDGPAPSGLSVPGATAPGSGVLSVYSLSKQSNLAGYRAALVAGDPQLIAAITRVRKHAGMLMPAPVQAAMVAALTDSTHVGVQRERYLQRRIPLRAALTSFGLQIDHSEAGLYLWATRDEDCWETLGALADRGLLVGPGVFYGAAAQQHVRIAITATDEVITQAVRALSEVVERKTRGKYHC